jgi:spore coat polysaccharide biosynthesis protein SpsF (cytidylyltransferase family)
VPDARRVDAELVDRVVTTTGLSPGVAQRVVEDVLAYYAEPVTDYVRRRHAQLRTYGARNSEIFARISEELSHRVVAAPDLTERQLRRLVYG